MTAIALAETPNEVYDELSLDDQDRFDRIAANGYRPEADGARWSAFRGEERVGPFPNLEQLAEAVFSSEFQVPSSELSEDEDAEPDGVVVELTEDHRGNTFLPSMGLVVDQQLADAAGKFHADNTDWKDAGKKRRDSLASLEAVAELKRGLFRPDPDNSNSLIYHAGGLLIRIARESKSKVTVEEEKDGD